MSITRLGMLFMFVVGLAASASASTFVVDFNPAAPANTNGWDFGTTTTNATKSGTQQGGRKFDTKDKEVAVSIESPVYESKILSVALSAWGNSVNTGNQSKIEVFGRASSADAYQLLFSRTSLSNKAQENEPYDQFSVPADVVCHQIKISYTKDMGTLTLSTVTVTDDAIRAETPTNVRITGTGTDPTGTGTDPTGTGTGTDPTTRGVTVSWDLPTGVTTSEYKIDVVTMTGGIDDSNPIWRESFASVPARGTARQVSEKFMSEWGLSDWKFGGKVYQSIAGALIIGWTSSEEGTLATPPLSQDLAEGHCLLVRAQKYGTVKDGNLPIYRISGATTSLIETVTLPAKPTFASVPLPALSANDRILFHSSTVSDVKNLKTLIDDVAICTAADLKAECVTTNAATETDFKRTDLTSMTFDEPEGRTQHWFSVRSVYNGEASAWSEPIQLVAAASSSDGAGDSKTDEGGDTGGDSSGDTGGGESALTVPTGVRAGTLPDGRIRIGWTTPDAATNVTLRVWTLSQTGGLAEASEGDFLWRETFANAPATNNNIAIDKVDKFNLYTDKSESLWDIDRCVAASLAENASAIKIGTASSKAGALVTKALNTTEKNLTLVMTARNCGKDKNIFLRAATLTSNDVSTTTSEGGETETASPATVATNELGQVLLSKDFAEYAFPITNALDGTESLLVESGTNGDMRVAIDDIQLVRNYKPITTVTNEVVSIDFDEDEDECELEATNVVRYAALCVRDARGESGAWTDAVELDPATLEAWRDHHLTLDSRGRASAMLDIETYYDGKKKKFDVTDEPFRFSTNGIERLELGCQRITTKSIAGGVHVYTNVFEQNWIVLVPGDSGRVGVTNEAEMCIAIETGVFAARKFVFEGTFAQLRVTNEERRELLFQWRWVTKDAAAEEPTPTAWIDFGSYATTYAADDDVENLDEALSEAILDVRFEVPLQLPDTARTRAPAGARIEVRVLNRRAKGQKEAPLGFCDVRVSVESEVPGGYFVIR